MLLALHCSLLLICALDVLGLLVTYASEGAIQVLIKSCNAFIEDYGVVEHCLWALRNLALDSEYRAPYSSAIPLVTVFIALFCQGTSGYPNQYMLWQQGAPELVRQVLLCHPEHATVICNALELAYHMTVNGEP